jgi:hypothetical protein
VSSGLILPVWSVGLVEFSGVQPGLDRTMVRVIQGGVAQSSAFNGSRAHSIDLLLRRPPPLIKMTSNVGTRLPAV